jgi:hypothetical protein
LRKKHKKKGKMNKEEEMKDCFSIDFTSRQLDIKGII